MDIGSGEARGTGTPSFCCHLIGMYFFSIQTCPDNLNIFPPLPVFNRFLCLFLVIRATYKNAVGGQLTFQNVQRLTMIYVLNFREVRVSLEGVNAHSRVSLF